MIGFIEEGKKIAKKQMDITLHGLWGPGVPTPLQACLRTHLLLLRSCPEHMPWGLLPPIKSFPVHAALCIAKCQFRPDV